MIRFKTFASLFGGLSRECQKNDGQKSERQLAKNCMPSDALIRYQGTPIHLGEHATNSIALILHELATNAAKYGALSVDHGSVSVAWEVAEENLHLRWRENNGPEISAPTKKGFGSALVERTISGHGGALDYAWFPRGLTANIRIPMSQVAR